jgi:HemY protein
MLRLLAFFIVIGALATGLTWLADNPGDVALTWRGVEYQVSLTVALGVVLAIAVALGILWTLLRLLIRAPSLISLASRMRRREKGFNALTRGLIAVGSGDARAAERYAAEAKKFLGDEALTKLLRAQAAQLSGNRAGANAAFKEMLEHSETHALGLRGLHLEARRAGQADAAVEYAERAHRYAALPWAAQAVLDDRAQHSDWAAALATVESNAARKLLDRATANRWRAVLKTAMAQELAEKDSKRALALAQEALALAPGLVPAAVVAGKLLGAAGDYRKASKLLETAFKETPHPEIAAAYLRVRVGDSVTDRLARARALARVAPFDVESQLSIARAALDAKDIKAARAALAPLLRGDGEPARPTVRVCLLSAEIEEAEGNEGALREWLNRAAHAPRDRAWVADGVISDHWSPVSPTGVLDAYVWRTPDERLTAPQPAPLAPARPVVAPPSAAIEPPPPAAPPSAADSSASPPAAEAPRPAAATATRNGNVVMLPSAAPDDPGPKGDGSRGNYRMFANE